MVPFVVKRGDNNLVRMDNIESVDVFGVRILIREAESTVRMRCWLLIVYIHENQMTPLTK